MCDIMRLGRTSQLRSAPILTVTRSSDGADKSGTAMADQHVIMMTLVVMEPR